MAEETAHEKLIESELKRIHDNLGNLKDMVKSDINNLSDKVTELIGGIRKVLDDHEERLREQVKVDAAQGKDIAELQVKMAEMAKDLEAVQRAQKDSARDRADTWKRVALDLGRVAVFASFSGGTFAGIIQAFGGF